MQKVIYFIIVIFLPFFSVAQIEIVKDINNGVVPNSSSSPDQIIELNGAGLFAAVHPDYGMEIWTSDGTSEGTNLVKDINPNGSSDPAKLTYWEGNAYFFAYDGEQRNLWKTDGSNEGTVLVKELNLDNEITGNIGATSKGLIFSAYINGEWSVWMSDGTESGTEKISEDLDRAEQFTQLGETIFFVAFSSGQETYGEELWKTDGTKGGTVPVKDISSGSSYPKNLTVLGNTLFFTATDEEYGEELWKSDGTEEGTVIFKADELGGQFVSFYVWNDHFYFTSRISNVSSLWKSDGTEEGTVVLKDSLSASNFTIYNNELYFSGLYKSDGELWKTDGTTEGTVMAIDVYVGEKESYPSRLTVFGDMLIFEAYDGVHGRELWATDGTIEGTDMIKDINTSESDNYYGSYGFSNIFSLTSVGDILLFNGYDGGIFGRELWTTDGTEAGTQLVKDINYQGDSQVSYLTESNGSLFFRAFDQRGRELWKSNGTNEGTVLVKDINELGNGSPYQLTDVNGTLFFVADDGNSGEELWKSDGTEAGTVMVKDLRPGADDCDCWYLTASNSMLYFIARNEGGGDFALWRSDGTEAGTIMIKVVGSSNNVSNITSGDNWTYFVTEDETVGQELWKTDGTVEGTSLVADINPLGDSNPRNLIYFNGSLFFNANDGEHGNELWKTDGTEAGTLLVKDIVPGEESGNPVQLTLFNNLIFFHKDNSETSELWMSDGTTEGTSMIKVIRDYTHSHLSEFTVANGYLYFIDTKYQEHDLWMSDGTSDGTNRIKNNFFESKYIPSMQSQNEDVYILNEDNGISQIWSIQGSTVCRLVKEKIYINRPVFFNGELLFAGGTTEYGGYELMYLNDSQLPCLNEQNIEFDLMTEKNDGGATFILGATATSGLPITYESSDEAVATLSGDTITVHSIGTVTITAYQEGNDEFLPAEPVARELTVNVVTSLESSTKTNKPGVLYPNPAENYFIVFSENNLNTISIYDLKGVKHLETQVSNGTKVAVDHLKDGIYIIKVESTDTYKHYKLIKE